jgi:hypothetical protein
VWISEDAVDFVHRDSWLRRKSKQPPRSRKKVLLLPGFKFPLMNVIAVPDHEFGRDVLQACDLRSLTEILPRTENLVFLVL